MRENEALGYSVPRCCPTHVRRSHQVGEFQANALGRFTRTLTLPNRPSSALVGLYPACEVKRLATRSSHGKYDAHCRAQSRIHDAGTAAHANFR